MDGRALLLALARLDRRADTMATPSPRSSSAAKAAAKIILARAILRRVGDWRSRGAAGAGGEVESSSAWFRGDLERGEAAKLKGDRASWAFDPRITNEWEGRRGAGALVRAFFVLRRTRRQWATRRREAGGGKAADAACKC
jgi:hypothetical protein